VKSVAILFYLCIISCCAIAQSAHSLKIKEYNFYSFSSDIKSSNPELFKFSNAVTHPEFGSLPYNAGCLTCFEVLEKRTDDERYFLKDSSNGSEFFIQKSYTPMHYKDSEGRWITIDPRIKKVGDKKFIASQQQFPVGIDLEKRVHFNC